MTKSGCVIENTANKNRIRLNLKTSQENGGVAHRRSEIQVCDLSSDTLMGVVTSVACHNPPRKTMNIVSFADQFHANLRAILEKKGIEANMELPTETPSGMRFSVNTRTKLSPEIVTEVLETMGINRE